MTTNIANLLRNAPRGTKLYSPLFGECALDFVSCDLLEINIWNSNNQNECFDYEGRYNGAGECLLFPSKEVREWDNFTIKNNKKNDFKPFDKVIVRNTSTSSWKAELFSNYTDDPMFFYQCISDKYVYCIPYNEETAKLIGTTNNYK